MNLRVSAIHKVLTIPGYEGKMHAEDLENYIQVFYENESYEHTVFPGAVYLTSAF